MSDPRPTRVGTPAVPFELVDTTDTRHTLAQYRGRWLLLVFHRHLG
jgi:peroxiredoxin